MGRWLWGTQGRVTQATAGFSAQVDKRGTEEDNGATPREGREPLAAPRLCRTTLQTEVTIAADPGPSRRGTGTTDASAQS